MNDRFGVAFGFTPSAEGQQPTYKWVNTDEHTYYLETEAPEFQLSQSGLYLPAHDYERRRWSDRVGSCWMLAMWKPPVSLDEHLARYKGKIPYSRYGEYQLIENIRLNPGEVPNEDLTQQAIWAVGKHLGKKFGDFVQESEDLYAASVKEVNNRMCDEVFDAFTAFGNTPGKRNGGVSFGGI